LSVQQQHKIKDSVIAAVTGHVYAHEWSRCRYNNNTRRYCTMNYTRLIFAIFPAAVGILVFAIWINDIHVYAQQSYSVSSLTAPALQTSLSQLSKQSNNTGMVSNVTATTDLPIVLRPLADGTCPLEYHLVSGSVCIKDIASSPTKTSTPKASISTPATPTTNTTKSFSIPSPSAAQPNDTNPTSNQESFNTKILKSFNRDFKGDKR
jgi:hypothetical protein